eukprot:tig00000254_g22501.t1
MSGGHEAAAAAAAAANDWGFSQWLFSVLKFAMIAAASSRISLFFPKVRATSRSKCAALAAAASLSVGRA